IRWEERRATWTGHEMGGRAAKGAYPAADVKGRRTQDLSPLGHCQFGGAAADIDVKNTRLSLGREGNRARAMGGKQCFEIVARAGAHEIAALCRKDVGDRSCVGSTNGLASKNDRTGVHLLRSDCRLLISRINQPAERLVVNAFAARGVRSEVDR